jgi:hypothetical protein
VLKDTQITTLRRAPRTHLEFPLSTPIDPATPHLCSLASNELCGLGFTHLGTYTSEGITKLCEALKGSAVTSLKCAAAPVFAFLSMPIDTLCCVYCLQAR